MATERIHQELRVVLKLGDKGKQWTYNGAYVTFVRSSNLFSSVLAY